MKTVTIGNQQVGDGHACCVVAEIGINHNGDVGIAKMLIDVAVDGRLRGGQVPEAHGGRGLHGRGAEQAARVAVRHDERRAEAGARVRSRRVPRDRSSLSREEYAVVRVVLGRGVGRFHGRRSIRLATRSRRASLTDDALLRHTRATGRPVILATGMSTMQQIDHAVEVLGTDQLVILHACSTYPAHYDELNLRVIPQLRARYRCAGRIFGTRDRHRVERRGGRARRIDGRAPPDAGPLDVGQRSGGLARAERHHAPRSRHPSGRDVDGRRREARARSRDPRSWTSCGASAAERHADRSDRDGLRRGPHRRCVLVGSGRDRSGSGCASRTSWACRSRRSAACDSRSFPARTVR